MHADLKGALAQINRSYKAFEHNGKSLQKHQVKAILEYGIKKSYQTTAELSNEEINNVLKQLK